MKEKQLNDYFTAQIAACAAEEKRLNQEDRKDEAVFAKIRGNVFDIFRTVFSAGVKTVGQEQAGEFLREKLDSIPRSWQAALEKAQAHGEGDKACIESVKLEAVREIRQTAGELWGWTE